MPFADGVEISDGATHSYTPSKYSSFRQLRKKLYNNDINPGPWDPGLMSQVKFFVKLAATCKHASTHKQTLSVSSPETTIGILLSCIEPGATN